MTQYTLLKELKLESFDLPALDDKMALINERFGPGPYDGEIFDKLMLFIEEISPTSGIFELEMKGYIKKRLQG